MNSRFRKQNPRVLLSALPAELKPWLYASGSLTQQLTDLAQGQFHVEPIQEHFQRLSFANAKWMQMSPQHTSWVRESYLYGSEQFPWVKAKSIFPILSLQKSPNFSAYWHQTDWLVSVSTYQSTMRAPGGTFR